MAQTIDYERVLVEGPSRPLPGARAAVALLLAINLFNYIDRYVLAAVLPRIEETMLAGDPNAHQKAGWLATAFLLSYMLLSPVFGWLADRVSRWALVGVGVILWSLASGESGRASFFSVLLITRMFVGIGEAAYGPAAPSIISDLYPVRHRGRILAWFYMAIPVGSALGYALGGVMDQFGHWRWAFYAVVPPGILLGVLCFFMPNPRRGQADATAVPNRKPRMQDYGVLLRTPSYILNCLGMAALTFAIGGISYWMPKYINSKGVPLATANTIFGAITVLTGISATLLGGYVGDRLRTRFGGAYFLVSAFGLTAAFPLFLLVMATPFPLAWVFIFLCEFCLFFNTGPSNTALANVTHPSMRASAFALNILVIHALGDAISPPIIGAIADHYNSNLTPGFLVVGVVMLVGAFFWFWGARHLGEDTRLAPYRLAPDARM